MNIQEKNRLSLLATEVRKLALEGIYCAKSGHPGGSLSIADILTYLYFSHMRVNPEDCKNEERDRFVLSKGHACPALYGALALRGFFPAEDLKMFRNIDGYLQGHPDMNKIPGVDMSTGSLGQGISAACGMAKAGKMFGNSYRVYAVLGDGELQEGQVWEAFMFAAHNKLDNLCAIIDNNGLQIDGDVSKVMSPYPIDEKMKAFGFNVIAIYGHDFEQIEAALNKAQETKGKPTVIIAKTIKGKGVSFMENVAGWHGNAPNTEQYEAAIAELDAKIAELGGTL